MARFDPMTYPDRLAVEAYGRDMRHAEYDRVLSAAVDWAQRRRRQVAAHVARVAHAVAAVLPHDGARPAR